MVQLRQAGSSQACPNMSGLRNRRRNQTKPKEIHKSVHKVSPACACLSLRSEASPEGTVCVNNFRRLKLKRAHGVNCN